MPNLLRVLAQPALALAASGATSLALQASLIFSGALELGGASLALGMLARTLREGPPLKEREGFRSVPPFLLASGMAFWLALSVNLIGLGTAVAAGAPLVPNWADRLTLQVAFYAFLVPIAVAMSVRTFGLYFRTRPPRMRTLRLHGLSAYLWLVVIIVLLVLSALAAAGVMAEAMPVDAERLGALVTFGINVGPAIYPRPDSISGSRE